jgi:fumarate hydratase class II
MIIGYQRYKACEPGQLVRARSGEYMIISEYYNDEHVPSAYLSGSGENAAMNPNEWVAIIDLDQIEADVEEELDYPKEET